MVEAFLTIANIVNIVNIIDHCSPLLTIREFGIRLRKRSWVQNFPLKIQTYFVCSTSWDDTDQTKRMFFFNDYGQTVVRVMMRKPRRRLLLRCAFALFFISENLEIIGVDSDVVDIVRSCVPVLLAGFFLLRRGFHINHRNIPRFDLGLLSDAQCLALCRVSKSNLIRLHEVLCLPNELRDDKGRVYSGIEGLALVLARLAYPGRFCD